jgi:hypothetical protein
MPPYRTIPSNEEPQVLPLAQHLQIGTEGSLSEMLAGEYRAILFLSLIEIIAEAEARKLPK